MNEVDPLHCPRFGQARSELKVVVSFWLRSEPLQSISLARATGDADGGPEVCAHVIIDSSCTEYRYLRSKSGASEIDALASKLKAQRAMKNPDEESKRQQDLAFKVELQSPLLLLLSADHALSTRAGGAGASRR